ncbi:transketolase [Ureaplasma diversum]|uniref:Transketolase n=1 Tax=Ureaplasma diversum TaxID=42094 RepID=A0A0C5RLI9_9BACT|nr:transketolase [Ureaplasma diversum]AJQ45558.1 transketolase [Ureaplasma diversum]
MNRYVNAMRSLALQAIKNANQGHSGMSISAAPILYTLYKGLMTISKDEPKWFNRDRLVLSAGHGSMALYPIFYFASLISLDDIKNFRNDNTNTPGHPEVFANNYVDASTGPLGQGVSNAVGMAIAERYLANLFPTLKGLINHFTYCVVGDGDLQEGICYEAMSLAGKLELNKLIMIHDSNDYQLDSAVFDVNIENLQQRVESMNWNYLSCDNNPENIHAQVAVAKSSKNNKPTFIEVKTIIGEGMSSEQSANAHAAAVNDQELELFSKKFRVKVDNFDFHQEIFDHFHFNVVARGNSAYEQWKKLWSQYEQTQPEAIAQFKAYLDQDFENLDQILDPNLIVDTNDATRVYIKNYFSQLKDLKSMMVLSADLAKSTYVKIGSSEFNVDSKSPYVKCGIREFAMAGIMNGILLHSGLKACSGTFLAFADYMKAAMRLAAISHLPAIYFFSHDSYAIGSDGPTHQPVEQLTMLRSIPNFEVIRVTDHYETKHALVYAYKQTTKPVAIITSRQKLKQINESEPTNFSYGAYQIIDQKLEADQYDVCLIASGSEVSLIKEAAHTLKKENINIKVISCFNLNQLLLQDSSIIKNLLDAKCGLISVEASNDTLWWKLSPFAKTFKQISATNFGRSADGAKLMNEFGFNVDNVIKEVKSLISK